MAARKKTITFNTEASINLADDADLMALMVAAGFDSVFIGIETPNDESLAECGKRQNRNRDLIGSVKSLQRAGLQVQAGFIVGFDHDSPGTATISEGYRRSTRAGRSNHPAGCDAAAVPRGDEGAGVENLATSHWLKRCHAIEDRAGHSCGLGDIRDGDVTSSPSHPPLRFRRKNNDPVFLEFCGKGVHPRVPHACLAAIGSQHVGAVQKSVKCLGQ
jgi:hypothetical protein